MFSNKAKLIENLTGVNSSKLNYYVELKKRNEEIVKQNNRLEIIHQLVRNINIDMSFEDIIKSVYGRLPLAVSCDFLGLALLRGERLFMTAMMPQNSCLVDPVPGESFLWQCVRDRGAKVFGSVPKQDPFLSCNPALAEGIISLAAVPLFFRSEVKGLLLVGSAAGGVYTHEELNFIHQLADQLAICIQNASLYEQVSRAKQEWEETFRAVTEPILLIDSFHTVLRCNDRLPAGMNFKGDIGDKKGKIKCFELLWGRSSVCDECPMEEVRQTGKPVFKRVQRESGFVLDVAYFPVFNELGQITGVIHHIKDVTEKTKMEAQLVQSAKLAAIGEMAAGVAHELNNPMTVIIGTAQLMQREIDGDRQENELLNDIINCGLRCKRIIQNLLTFSRQDQQPFAPVNLNEEIERVLSLVQYQINRNNIDIARDLSADLPIIAANGHQLQQVLINFLLNARDAFEGVVREKKIIVSTSLREASGKQWVLATVNDNGTGIAPENLTKIFNPFYTSKEATKGTGLGLSVSLGIAEAHGGTIEVSSVPGEGSSFSLVLPVEEGF